MRLRLAVSVGVLALVPSAFAAAPQVSARAWLVQNAATGEVLSHYSTANEPGNELLMRCKNRRASRCPSCSEEYRGDTHQLVKAGIVGGDKGVPTSVGLHPRAFVTLTAPSFGPVHQGPGKDGRTRICHPRRTGPACFTCHRADAPRIGQPLDPSAYDYVGHVLWHAHTGELWRRFTLYLRNHLASAVGVGQSMYEIREYADTNVVGTAVLLEEAVARRAEPGDRRPLARPRRPRARTGAGFRPGGPCRC